MFYIVATKLKSILRRGPREFQHGPSDLSLIAAVNEARTEAERRRIAGI
jgi:hypothetical protein